MMNLVFLTKFRSLDLKTFFAFQLCQHFFSSYSHSTQFGAIQAIQKLVKSIVFVCYPYNDYNVTEQTYESRPTEH